LERDATDGDRAHWTAHFARPKVTTESGTESMVIFRVASEWLALPTAAVVEIARALAIHSLPHRSRGILLGVTSVRGELLACLSLARALDIEPAAGTDPAPNRTAPQRLLVIRRDRVRAVCPVDEVHGIHRARRHDLRDLPATVGRAAATCS